MCISLQYKYVCIQCWNFSHSSFTFHSVMFAGVDVVQEFHIAEGKLQDITEIQVREDNIF